MAEKIHFTESIEERGDTIVAKGVPIFDVHEDQSRPDGFKVIDQPLLERIVAANRNKIADTGDRIPFVYNHTGKNNENPAIVAWGTNPRLGKIGNLNPRAAILVDMHVPKENWESVKAHQRRSVEIDPLTLDLDPVALLGGRTPARYLGPIAYERKGERIHYELPSDEPGETPLETKGMLGPEDIAAIKACFKECLMEVINEEEADETPTEPAATETPMPAQTPPETTPEPDMEKDKYAKMAREQYAAQSKRLEAQLKAANDRLAALEHDRDSSAIEAELVKMESDEGLQFDRGAEHKHIMSLPAEARKQHYERMRANYKRDITMTPRIVPMQGVPNQSNEIDSEADENSIIAYARQNKVSFDVAKEKVMAAKRRA